MSNQLNTEQKALQRMLKSQKMNHPEVIIIYAPNGASAYMTGANWNGKEWRYTKSSEMPESDVNGFLQVFLEEKYTVIDARVQANLAKPGMGDATPILVVRPDVNLRHATQAAAVLHQAILDS